MANPKVTHLKLAPKPVNESVVTLLTDLLGRALEGNLQGFVAVSDEGTSVHHHVAGEFETLRVLAMLDLLQHRMRESIIDQVL